MLQTAAGTVDDRILDAALERLEVFGPRRTTIEDVARAARTSRITVYRRFKNRDALLQAVVVREVERFFEALEDAVRPYESFSDRLAEGFAFALGYTRGHALLGRLLRTEPEALLPYLTGSGGGVVAVARANLAERLWRNVLDGRIAPGDVDVLAELLARLVLSFVTTPETAATLDTPDDARAFAHRYLVPIVDAAAGSADAARLADAPRPDASRPPADAEGPDAARPPGGGGSEGLE